MVIEILKAKAGFGGVKLEIHIRKDEYRRNEPLCGEVHVLGGRTAQKIRALNLRLLRLWSTESYGMDTQLASNRSMPRETADSISAQYMLEGNKGKDEILHIDLGMDIEIHAGQRRIFPFEINLSKIKREEGVQESWKLQAKADIPYARDAIAEREIKMLMGKGAARDGGQIFPLDK